MVSESLVPEEQIPYLHDALSAAARRRDSAVAQAVILVAAYVVSFLSVGLGIGADTAMAPHGGPMTPLRLYYGAVSLPLFWFLVVVWIWRFLSWLLVLFRISQLHLSLVPAHSDRTGGMKFLANTQASFPPVVFALGCVYAIATRSAVSGNWSNDALRLTGPQMTYTIGALVVLFAPLAFFSRQLLIAKRDAHERYSELVGRLCRSFEAKWFGRTAPRTGPLGTQDPSSQIDLSSSFDIVESMRWFPFGLRAVVAVVGAGLGALVPRLLLDRELLEALLALKSQIA